MPASEPGAIVPERMPSPEQLTANGEPPQSGPRHAAASWTVLDADTSRLLTHRDSPADGTPLVHANQVALQTVQGRVFGPVDWTVPADGHGLVLGEQGSGRSSFLLALAGRMQGTTGVLRIAGLDAIVNPRQVRKVTSVARITDLVELEPNLTVGEARDERSLAEGIRVKKGRLAFSDLQDALDHRFDTDRQIGDLPADERALLTAVLGCLRPADLVVFDDIDESLTEQQVGVLYEYLAVLAQLGHHFIASAVDRTTIPPGVEVLRLAPPETGDSLALRFAHIRNRRVSAAEPDVEPFAAEPLASASGAAQPQPAGPHDGAANSRPSLAHTPARPTARRDVPPADQMVGMDDLLKES